MPHLPLHRGSLLLLTLLAPATLAQTHHVAPPQQVTRAVAVYEYTGDLTKPTAARIVPVSIFINGHLEDAGIYLARPMPMAIQTGVVYSIEKAGESKGTLDVDYARNIITRHSGDANPDDISAGAWYGYGKFALPAPPAPVKPLPASTQHVNIAGSDDDDRPHFVGKQPGQPDPTPATPTTPTSSTSTPDDPDRPHLSRRTDSTTPAADTTTPAPDPDAPTLRHRDPEEAAKKEKRSKPSDSGVIPIAGSLNDDPNRPTLRHGKPAAEATLPELTTLPPDLHQVTAVSDAANREPHIFTRPWDSPADRAQTLADIQKIAQTEVAKYLATNHLTPPQIGSQPANPTPPAPAPTTPQAVHGKTSHVRLPEPQTPPIPVAQLLQEQLTGLTLSYGGLPTFVYSAQVPVTTGGPVYITLVAQRLPSGELQPALTSITDATHLDRTPWLRFIDAVDPDASHRAGLLFELRAQTSRQFALYLLTTAKAQQQFVTNIIE